jgi:plastocyanin
MKSRKFLSGAFALVALLLLGTCLSAQITVNAGINNQTFNTCNEFIIDSGGQGGPGYSNNENITFTICSDNPGDQVTVTFNLFALSTVDTAPGNANNSDQMYVFDGPNTGANSLGNYGGTGLQGVVIQATPQNTTGCLTFQFVSNDQGTGNFTASASCNTPCATPQAGGVIVGGITPDSIRVCVGELVTFQEQGSFAQPGFNLESYTWDFMDGTQETATTPGAQVEHAFTQPGNFLVQLFVNVTTLTTVVSILTSFHWIFWSQPFPTLSAFRKMKRSASERSLHSKLHRSFMRSLGMDSSVMLKLKTVVCRIHFSVFRKTLRFFKWDFLPVQTSKASMISKVFAWRWSIATWVTWLST